MAGLQLYSSGSSHITGFHLRTILEIVGPTDDSARGDSHGLKRVPAGVVI